MTASRRPVGHGPRARVPGDRVLRTERGQASVEVVAIAPVVGLVVIGLALGLQAHSAGEAAGLAAHAAGLAAMQGRDPRAAARAAVPDVDAERLRVSIDGDAISVRVRAAGPRALVSSFDAERRVVAHKAGDR